MKENKKRLKLNSKLNFNQPFKRLKLNHRHFQNREDYILEIPCLEASGMPVTLRRAAFSDLSVFHAVLQNKAVYFPVNKLCPPTIPDLIKWYFRVKCGAEGYVWAITYQHKPIGSCRLFNYVLGTHKSAELGIMIDPKYWNKGIGTKTCQLLIDYSRNVLRLDALYVTVLYTNYRALHLYKKLGFKETAGNGKFLKMVLKFNRRGGDGLF